MTRMISRLAAVAVAAGSLFAAPAAALAATPMHQSNESWAIKYVNDSGFVSGNIYTDPPYIDHYLNLTAGEDTGVVAWRTILQKWTKNTATGTWYWKTIQTGAWWYNTASDVSGIEDTWFASNNLAATSQGFGPLSCGYYRILDSYAWQYPAGGWTAATTEVMPNAPAYFDFT
jgi:hypothetical protein